MTYIAATTDLEKALRHEGIVLPDGCVGVSLEMNADSVMCLVYKMLVTGDDLQKVCRALDRMAKEQA